MTRALVPSLLAVPLLWLSTSASSAPAKLSYYGGRVISHVQVVEVNWGPNVDAAVTNGLPGFFTAITQSPYLDWLEEYDTHITAVDGMAGSNQVIGRGSFVGAFTITPSSTGSAITDANVQAELAAQIAAANLPAPHVDPNGYVDTLYMVEFPPGVSITGPSGSVSCVEFCAYHSAWLAPAGSQPYSGKTIAYSIQPDFNGACSGGCGSASVSFDNQTSVHSHQITEAITDPEVGLATGFDRPIAWYDSATGTGEIGDICNAQQATLGVYTVQKVWSNSASACIASDPTFPICTGSNGPACRLCNPSDEGVGCVGGTAYCDSTPGDPLEGRCVACHDATQCSGGTPFCDASTGACRACTPADCTGTLAVCETAGSLAGTCVACNASSSAGCPSATPICETTTDTCVECLTGTDCPSAKPVCSASHTCQPAGTSGGSSGGSTTGGGTTGGSTTGGGTTGGATTGSGGATSGGSTTGGTTSASGQKGGCATGGAGLVFPWLGSLLGLKRSRRRREG